ncbi:hypothetical protein [Jiangella rhizosphaerae]|nr:hypothetical protein [Jiangella rhizosphaerae]
MNTSLPPTGRVALVNNAALYSAGPIDELGADEFDRTGCTR